MLFKRYPKINYTFQDDKTIEVVDIFRKISISQSTLTNFNFFDTIIVSNGDTPEQVSRNLYDSEQFSPFILMTNQIINPNRDWATEFTTFNTELSNTYSGTALFTYKMQNAKVNDIVVKTDSIGRNLVTSVWGRVEEDYDKVLRKTLVKQISGTFAENDYFIILRKDGNKFQLVSDTPGGRLVRVESELSLPYKFYDQYGNTINPYRIVNRSTQTLTDLVADSDTEITTNLPYTDTTTLYNTVLFLYITSSAILSGAKIKVVSINDFENKRNEKNQTVKVPKRSFINTLFTLYDQSLLLDRVDRSTFVDVKV